MATLHQLRDDLVNTIEMEMDVETGECLEGQELYDAIDKLDMAINEKLENIGLYINQCLSDAEQIKVEKLKLEARQRQCNKRAESLKNYVLNFAKSQYTDEDGILHDEEMRKKFEVKTSRIYMKLTKSSKAEITDLSKVPNEFIKEKDRVEDDVKKTELLKYLKSLKEDDKCEYAKITVNNNLQFK